jgi:hypothetical protein
MRTQKSKKAKVKNHARALPRAAKPARVGAGDAVRHLRLIQHGTHIVEMFRKYFPAEFKAEGVDYGSYWGLLGSYDRFTELVSEKLFPVHNFSDSDQTYDEPEWALSTMGICIHAFEKPLWYERYGNGDEISLVERMIVSASGNQDFPDVGIALPKDWVGIALPKDWVFDLETLRELSWKEKGKLSGLDTAARALLGVTGNAWMDLDEEEYYQCEMPDWSEEQVEFLASEFDEAKAIKRDAEAFFAWCDRPARVNKVKAMLYRAQRPKEQKRVRVKTHSGKPLVETLGEFL